MKFFSKKLLHGIGLALCLVMAFYVNASALRPTSNLKTYENNLDILPDKGNGLYDLIGELQGFDVIRATCPASGGVIVDASITSSDTIVAAIVLSSANLVQSSSTTLVGTHDLLDTGAVIVRSKIPGTMGNNISLNFYQIASTNTRFVKAGVASTPTAGTLMVFTTGYAIDVWLSTHGADVTLAVSTTLGNYASASDVCSAIQNDAGANSLVTCGSGGYGTTTSTRAIVALSGILLSSGEGSTYAQNVIDGSFFTAGNGKITLGSNCPVSNRDSLILYIFRYNE